VNVPSTLVTLTQSAATATSSSFTIVGGHYRFAFTDVTGFDNGDITITIGAGWTAGATATSKTVTVVDATHPVRPRGRAS